MNRIKYIFILCSFCLVGCIKDVDFDQKDDIEIHTTHIVSLVHFDLKASDFIDNIGNETLSKSDTTELSLFSGSNSEKYLIQIDFDYVFSSSFNRTLSFEYEFLDENDNSLFSFQPINIPASTFNYEYTQSLFESDIQHVLETKKVVVNIQMSGGVPKLDESQLFKLNMMSGGVLHYKVTANE